MKGGEFDELYGALHAASSTPVTVGHLGQSLDGFIATCSGDSHYVNGRGNLLHLHRMRALCDAIVVGAGTVAADDPQLTTRLVPGPNPVRVVLDPDRRLGSGYRVFTDGAAPTVLACRERLADRPQGVAEVLAVPEKAGSFDLAALLATLHARGWRRVFVEGGGRTVSAFLAAGLLDRLQLAVAPLIIGEGRPAIRLPPPARLGDCRRPSHRSYRMGEDILFDCDLAAAPPAPQAESDAALGGEPPLVRIL
jgi:diaminohydroxyphosphoribosylaminopyrimidine deaminase / 5-amino-6-(5-phosphoribosylamino)uracil reductase